jgi:hypothetical protein
VRHAAARGETPGLIGRVLLRVRVCACQEGRAGCIIKKKRWQPRLACLCSRLNATALYHVRHAADCVQYMWASLRLLYPHTLVRRSLSPVQSCQRGVRRRCGGKGGC